MSDLSMTLTYVIFVENALYIFFVYHVMGQSVVSLLSYHQYYVKPNNNNNNNSMALVCERLYRQSDRHLSAKLVPTSADRGVLRGQRGGSLRP
jgi:hypothetical protein